MFPITEKDVLQSCRSSPLLKRSKEVPMLLTGTTIRRTTSNAYYDQEYRDRDDVKHQWYHPLSKKKFDMVTDASHDQKETSDVATDERRERLKLARSIPMIKGSTQ
jgi:hypothetical protein